MKSEARERWCEHHANPDLCIICKETKPLKQCIAELEQQVRTLDINLGLSMKEVDRLRTILDMYVSQFLEDKHEN